jgi:hypothetical protein
LVFGANIDVGGGKSVLRYSFLLLLVVLTTEAGFSQNTDRGQQRSAYASVELRPWLSIAVPSSWRVQSDEMTGTVAAYMEAFGIDSTEALESFGANLFMPEIGLSVARMNVRFYPDPQKPDNFLLDTVSAEDIEYLDQELRSGLQDAMHRLGGRVTAWYGSRLVQIGGRNFIVTSYQRDSTAVPGGDVSIVYLHRYWDRERSFTLTTACRVEFCPLVLPVLQHMQNSIEVE